MTNAASRARPPEARAVRAYVEQAVHHGHTAQVLDVSEFDRLPGFDAVFLRLDTNVLGLSFAAGRLAWDLGLRTVDDPRSILTCTNKAHVQGLLELAGVPTPETVLLTKAGSQDLDPAALFEELGTPIVCKAPAGAFSSAVEKADDARSLRALLARFARGSDVILLQRYEPSAFDWRVGVLAGQVIFTVKYHIPKGAWRIRDVAEGHSRRTWARTERIPEEQVPKELVTTALAAASVVGHGLYGVDLKQRSDGSFLVIEVNDNPNIDWGGELAPNSPRFGEILDRVASHGPRG